jgi:hypothetical protein
MASRSIAEINRLLKEQILKEQAEESGKVRDGSMLVDKKYINMAKDLGLGSREGVYSHIKSFSKIGIQDIPYSSINASALNKKNGEKAKKIDKQEPKNTVEKKTVHGLDHTTTKSSHTDIHNHASSFTHQKGVVATLKGAKNVSNPLRKENSVTPAPTSSRISSSTSSAQGSSIMTIKKMEQSTKEGKKRQEAIEMREQLASSAKSTISLNSTRSFESVESGGVHTVSDPPSGSIKGKGLGGGAIQDDKIRSTSTATSKIVSNPAHGVYNGDAMSGSPSSIRFDISSTVGNPTETLHDRNLVREARVAYFKQQEIERKEKKKISYDSA